MEHHSQESIFGNSKAIWLSVLVVVLIAGFAVRMIDLKDLPLDFHPMRQLRSAIIARGLYYQMQPSANPGQLDTAIESTDSFETFELPVIEWITAVAYIIAGDEHLWLSRIFSSLYWIIGGLALFDTSRRATSVDGGLVALSFYLFLPFAVIASRSFQPDPFMVMWMMLSVWAITRWLETREWKWAIIAGILTGLAIFTKLYPVFVLSSALVVVCLYSFGLKGSIKNRQVWVIAGLSIVIPSLYYLPIVLTENSGSFFSFWTVSFLPLLAKPYFYLRWLELINSIMDLSLFFAALVGVVFLRGKYRALVSGLWLGYLLYGLFLPYQIHTHNYYSLPLIPIIALSLASLIDLISQKLDGSGTPWKFAPAGILIFVIILCAWNVRVTFLQDDYTGEGAGWRKISAQLPEDGTIIGLVHEYGYRLRYFGMTRVKVWPETNDLGMAEVRNQGAQQDFNAMFDEYTAGSKYFLITLIGELDAQPELKQKLYNGYQLIHDGDGYLLFDLSQPIPPSQ